ncbi:MAG: hypothetical protein J7K85_00075 [Anaerolineaceae bacterium]|nr:hypothetical protein [Anaerolineaceae bacterium]
MNDILLILNKIFPVLVFLFLGSLFRRIQLLKKETIDDLKKFIVNVSLPAVLFVSFLNTTIELRYLVLMIVMFLLCVVLLVIAKRFYHRKGARYIPFLFTGFEFGMLGISLFASAYGMDAIGPIAIIGIGHEFFIWFVYLTFLLKENEKATSAKSLLRSFFTSPVILAILSSVLLNLLGLRQSILNLFFSEGLFTSLEWLLNLTPPIILIIVGYEIHFSKKTMKESAKLVLMRILLILPFGLFISFFIVHKLLGLTLNFQIALWTFLLLPPPFILPLYMPPGFDNEKSLINNTLFLNTIISIVLFIVLFAFFPVL